MLNIESLKILKIIIVLIFISLLTGCAQKISHKPLDKETYDTLAFSDSLSEDRWWGDTLPPSIKKNLVQQAEILKQRFPTAINADIDSAPAYNSLTISGGGADGAFGAGLLVGWTESGQRPLFEMVTGTSTGAVLAPFAFLGSGYDEVLLNIYRELTKDKIYQSQLLSGIFGGSSIADTTSLQEQIKKYITLDLIEKIAEQHKKSRSLFIVTTHLDAMRPMIWDIGGIASRRNIASVKLIRKIILASAAIPVMFPPVTFEFKKDGKSFTELHVDGGVTRNAFSYPAKISIKEIEKIQGLTFKRNVYVIQNGNSKLPFTPAPVDMIGIATRTTLDLLQEKINADVERIYYLTQRDEVGFNMIEIPDDFIADRAIDFDPEYMNQLIKLGQNIGRTGNFWHSTPPSIR